MERTKRVKGLWWANLSEVFFPGGKQLGFVGKQSRKTPTLEGPYRWLLLLDKVLNGCNYLPKRTF